MHPDPFFNPSRPVEGAPSDDDRPCGGFFHGVVNALTVPVILIAVVWIAWLMMSNAFAGAPDRPAGCEAYRGGEVAACVAELRA